MKDPKQMTDHEIFEALQMMIRNISFVELTGAIRVETETNVEIISSGIVLLTLAQSREAIKHGWKLHGKEPFSKETTPWLYAVKKGGREF